MLILTKEQEIQNYMDKLKISREEAEQLFEDDHSDEVLPEVAEMEKKAKEIRRYEKADKPKAKSKRVPKIDEEKVQILRYIADKMEDRHRLAEEDEWVFHEVLVKNPQKEITFSLNGCEYSLTLTKHRPPKA